MIRTEGLTKLFNQGRNQPSITAVEDLTLQVEEGEVFGFSAFWVPMVPARPPPCGC